MIKIKFGEIYIKDVDNMSLLAAKHNMPMQLKQKRYSTNIRISSPGGCIVYCAGVCGNTTDEEKILISHLTNQTKCSCVITNNNIEELDIISRILLYDRMYDPNDFNRFVVLIAPVPNQD